MTERSPVQFPAVPLPASLGQLSLPSLRPGQVGLNRVLAYWLGLGHGARSLVSGGRSHTAGDALYSCEMGFLCDTAIHTFQGLRIRSVFERYVYVGPTLTYSILAYAYPRALTLNDTFNLSSHIVLSASLNSSLIVQRTRLSSVNRRRSVVSNSSRRSSCLEQSSTSSVPTYWLVGYYCTQRMFRR